MCDKFRSLNVSISASVTSGSKRSAYVYGPHAARSHTSHTDISGITLRRKIPSSNPSVRENFFLSELYSDLDVVELRIV
jgi:hypothetical protein